MGMFGLDTVLKAPGEIAKQAVVGQFQPILARLPFAGGLVKEKLARNVPNLASAPAARVPFRRSPKLDG